MPDEAKEYEAARAELINTTNKIVDSFADQVAKAEAEWIDGLMRLLLPESIYGKARNRKIRKEQGAKLVQFMKQHKIRVEHHEDLTRMMHGEIILGEFKVQMVNRKLVIRFRNAKEIARIPEPQGPVGEAETGN